MLDAYFADQADPSRPGGIAFLFVDLNRFKEVNDSFGHPAGDELLRQLGPRLAGACGASDVVVRFGGDEFGVVLIDADQLRARPSPNACRQPRGAFDPERRAGADSASIGIAIGPTDATDATGLLRCADVAMYRAKLAARPYAIYDRRSTTTEPARLVDELRERSQERRSSCSTTSRRSTCRAGEITAVEALVRWPHPATACCRRSSSCRSPRTRG